MGNRTFRYHREHGARIFDSDNLPSEADGWYDSPAKLKLQADAFRAQDVGGYPNVQAEIQKLRDLIDQQALRIRELSEENARLREGTQAGAPAFDEPDVPDAQVKDTVIEDEDETPFAEASETTEGADIEGEMEQIADRLRGMANKAELEAWGRRCKPPLEVDRRMSMERIITEQLLPHARTILEAGGSRAADDE